MCTYVYTSSLAYHMYGAIVLFSLRHNCPRCSIKRDSCIVFTWVTNVFVLYACSWDLGTHKLISELECHSEKASRRFDQQHGWKDDKTTFNSFEFWHWLIIRHKKTMCWNKNSIIFGELLPLANAENNRVWRRSEALLFAAGAALSVQKALRLCRKMSANYI